MSRSEVRRLRKATYRAPDPRAICADYPNLHPSPSDEMLQYLWAAVKHRAYTPIKPIGGGREFECFINVAQKLAQDGGRAVLGWAIQPGKNTVGNTNRLARYWVDSHCVWQSPDGQLLDVTDGYDEAVFVHNPWALISNMQCTFIDHIGKANGVGHRPFKRILVTLPRSPMFEERPVVSVDGKTLAAGIKTWRFHNDPREDERIRLILNEMLVAEADAVCTAIGR